MDYRARVRDFLANNEQVIVVSGGVLLTVRSSAGIGMIDIEAEQLIFWTRGDGNNALNRMQTSTGLTSQEQEFYLAGKKMEATMAVPDALVDEVALCGPREAHGWRGLATRLASRPGSAPNRRSDHAHPEPEPTRSSEPGGEARAPEPARQRERRPPQHRPPKHA